MIFPTFPEYFSKFSWVFFSSSFPEYFPKFCWSIFPTSEYFFMSHKYFLTFQSIFRVLVIFPDFFHKYFSECFLVFFKHFSIFPDFLKTSPTEYFSDFWVFLRFSNYKLPSLWACSSGSTTVTISWCKKYNQYIRHDVISWYNAKYTKYA